MEMEDGKVMHLPCKSPFCPKHWPQAMCNWSERMITEISQAKYSYFAEFPVGYYRDYHTMKLIWHKWYDSMAYRYPGFRYCFVIESQDKFLHLHGVVTHDKPIDDQWMKRQWRKFYGKVMKTEPRLARCHAAPVTDAIRAAQYITKTSTESPATDLLPRSFGPRLVLASHHYGKLMEQRSQTVPQGVQARANRTTCRQSSS